VGLVGLLAAGVRFCHSSLQAINSPKPLSETMVAKVSITHMVDPPINTYNVVGPHRAGRANDNVAEVRRVMLVMALQEVAGSM
jgi:hypothetical protein